MLNLVLFPDNPLLRISLVFGAAVIVCWGGANVLRFAIDRSRRREERRRGGLLDFSRRRW